MSRSNSPKIEIEQFKICKKEIYIFLPYFVSIRIIWHDFFYPNNLIFQKKSQNNSLFRLFPKIPHFEEEAPDESSFALKLREETSIGLASPPSVVKSIGACVLSFKGGTNWSGTCVCFVIFKKNIVHFR